MSNQADTPLIVMSVGQTGASPAIRSCMLLCIGNRAVLGRVDSVMKAGPYGLPSVYEDREFFVTA